MMNGLSQQRMDEISLRLLGADHRPWTLSPLTNLDDEGRRTVNKNSHRAVKKAFQAGAKSAIRHKGAPAFGIDTTDENEILVDAHAIAKFLVLFHRTDHSTDDMMEFVAHAPEDIEDLVREVQQLRIMVDKLKTERDQAVKDLLGRRIAADRAEEKICTMRRAWRELCKEMGTKP